MPSDPVKEAVERGAAAVLAEWRTINTGLIEHGAPSLAWPISPANHRLQKAALDAALAPYGGLEAIRRLEAPLCTAREKVATVMLAHSIPTGHGDTIDDLLGELSGWLRDQRRAHQRALDEARAEGRREADDAHDAT